MTCRDHMHDVSLWVGGDLQDKDRVRRVKLHLAGCPDCRERVQSLRSALGALAVAAEPAETYEAVHELWPAVARRIRQSSQAAPSTPVWRQWAPVGLTTVLGLGLLVWLVPGREPLTPAGPVHLRTGPAEMFPVSPPPPAAPTYSEEERRPSRPDQRRPNF